MALHTKILTPPTWYIGVDEIQRDLDTFLHYNNLQRSHQGYRLKGRTPAQALREALGVEELPGSIPLQEENTPLATTPEHYAVGPGVGEFQDLYTAIKQ